MTLNLESTTTECAQKVLARYHHLIHIACVQKLRGLRQKLDALRVQTGPSLSKYKGFTRNSSVSKAFHFSKLILTQDFCLHSTCNIQSHILIFQTFLTSFVIFHAFNDLF